MDNETPMYRHRPRTTAAGAAVVAAALALALAACNEDEAQATPDQPNVAAAPGEAPAEQAPVDEAESEAAPTESACARVDSCCEVMGDQGGGGSLKKCQDTASEGDEEACAELLALHAQINAKDGHPLQGEILAECMPAP